MKNKSAWLHTGLLICFALPWVNVPFFVSTVSVTGFMLPFKTSELAQQLSELGVVTVSFHQMLPLYLILFAPALSVLSLIRLVTIKKTDVRIDSIAGLIAATGALYVLSNADDLVSIGLFAVIPVSLFLFASPLFHKEKTPTYTPLKRTA